jgi:hypothetical protein
LADIGWPDGFAELAAAAAAFAVFASLAASRWLPLLAPLIFQPTDTPRYFASWHGWPDSRQSPPVAATPYARPLFYAAFIV